MLDLDYQHTPHGKKGNIQHLLPKFQTVSNAVYSPTCCSYLFEAFLHIYTFGINQGFGKRKKTRKELIFAMMDLQHDK